jgi:glutamate-1-semialdehyde 2,1-aminomutase
MILVQSHIVFHICLDSFLFRCEIADHRQVTKRFSPSGIELVRFTNSGTESNTMAIAAAVAFTGRKKILVFTNAYHGGTLSFPSSLAVTNVNLPHDFTLAPYNDIQGTQSIISGLPRDSLAAILVEPVQGSGGCIVGKKDFLQYLDTTAHSLGAVFIVDEVMTSRLSYHGLSSELGLRPDLVTLGKWVGGGMTFGAFGGRKDGPMTMFDPRGGLLSHAGTFNNNVITMAAGCVGIDIYTEDEVLRLNALGESLKEGMEKVLSKYEIRPPSQVSPCPMKNELESPFTGTQTNYPAKQISMESLSLDEERGGAANMWVTGRGSMISIHFSGEHEKTLLALHWHHMLDHGIYMAQRGFMALNLELTEKHIERFVAAFDGFVGKYRQALSS